MICGPDGDKTKQLYLNTKEAVSKIGLEEEVVLEHNPKEMGKYGVLDYPAIVIDGKLIQEGKILSVDELVKIIQTA